RDLRGRAVLPRAVRHGRRPGRAHGRAGVHGRLPGPAAEDLLPARKRILGLDVGRDRRRPPLRADPAVHGGRRQGRRIPLRAPRLGVGQGQFIEHHYLTAHNSFLLTLAEMGPLGMLIYTAVLYLALKITLRAQIDLDRPEAAVARSWGASLMASLAALTVSSFF